MRRYIIQHFMKSLRLDLLPPQLGTGVIKVKQYATLSYLANKKLGSVVNCHLVKSRQSFNLNLFSDVKPATSLLLRRFTNDGDSVLGSLTEAIVQGRGCTGWCRWLARLMCRCPLRGYGIGRHLRVRDYDWRDVLVLSRKPSLSCDLRLGSSLDWRLPRSTY